MDKSAKHARIWELDALRGIAILCVIVIHLVFDLTYFLRLPIDLGPVFKAVQDYGGAFFVVLSGVCVTLGRRSFRRGLIVFGCGLLITAVTVGMVALDMADKSIAIWFGVLHLLGVCMMSYPLWKRLPNGALAVLSILLVVGGYVLLLFRFPVDWLFPLGIMSPDFASGDYFPLLPHLGWFMLGVVVGRTAYAGRQSLLPKFPANAAPIRFFQFCGRHSLWIYLAHQPLLYGLVWVLGMVM